MKMNVLLGWSFRNFRSIRSWKQVEVVRIEVDKLIWKLIEMGNQIVDIFLLSRLFIQNLGK